MNTKQWSLTILASAMLTLGCAGSDVTDQSFNDDIQVGTSTLATSAVFSGTVKTEQGMALAGASVSINGIARTTDSSGNYTISVAISTNGYVINVSKAGFAPVSEFFSAAKLKNIHVLQTAYVKQINPTLDNTISSNTGVKVTIQANTLVDASGAPVTGTVNVTIATYDPLRMPGDFSAVNSSGQQVALESVGAVSISATTTTGIPLNLRTGATATAFIPIPVQIGNMPPCVLDQSCRLAMWRFNASTGKWYERQANVQFSSSGTSFTMVGGNSTGLIPVNDGLGMWNADIEKTAPACTIITFTQFPFECYNPSGTSPEPGIQINLKLPNAAGTLISRTDRIDSQAAFVAIYNTRANVVQEVGITFPAGAPAYCAGNLTISSSPGPAPTFPIMSSTGGITRFNSGSPWGGIGFPKTTDPLRPGQPITSTDVAMGSVPCNSSVDFQTSSDPVPPVKSAMTWSLLASATPDSWHAYGLVGSDSITNPYSGDTLTTQSLPVLCIKKAGLPNPGSGVIGNPVQTPGGAWRRTWSGGTIALTTPVKGTSLTARSVADNLCANQFGTGFRMAEFHDGDPSLWSGWDFWADVKDTNIAPFFGTRFWVSINDQNANPW